MPIIDPDQGTSLVDLADLANNQAGFANQYASLLSRMNLRYTDEANRLLLHPANIEGEESYLTTLNRKELNTGAVWLSMDTFTAHFQTYLAADQLLTISSTVMQNVTGFSSPVTSGRTYLGSYTILYDSAVAADLRVQLTGPAMTNFRMVLTGLALTAAGVEGDFRGVSAAATATPLQVGGAGVGNVVAAEIAVLAQPSASGSLVLQAAQGTADATQTTLRLGTRMRISSVA